jgi:hypothetical protein
MALGKRAEKKLTYISIGVWEVGGLLVWRSQKLRKGR